MLNYSSEKEYMKSVKSLTPLKGVSQAQTDFGNGARKHVLQYLYFLYEGVKCKENIQEIIEWSLTEEECSFWIGLKNLSYKGWDGKFPVFSTTLIRHIQVEMEAERKRLAEDIEEMVKPS